MRALATKPPDSPLNEPKPRRLPADYLRSGAGSWRSIGEILGNVVDHLVIVVEQSDE